MQENPDVIVLGLSLTGLYAVREAARAGYSVLGVGTPGAPGLWSRFLKDRIIERTPEARVNALLKWLKKRSGKKPVLIVTSDQDIEAVIARASALSEKVHMQASYTDGVAEQIMDKDQFYKLCEKHSTPYPSLFSTTIQNIDQYRNKICYPSMIKPARIQDVKHLMAGKKGWIVKRETELKDILDQIPHEARTLLFQEIVPGPESNIMLWCGFFDKTGQVRQRFTARKLRQYPAGFGSASLVKSETSLETAEVAEALLSKLGYRGIAAAEFKLDPESGEMKIIEINPRPSLWFSITSAAGIPLIETAVAEANGTPLPPEIKQKDGIQWQYTSKDFASKLFYLWNRDFVLPPPDLGHRVHIKAHADVTGAWDDPAPIIGEAATFAKKVIRRLIYNCSH